MKNRITLALLALCNCTMLFAQPGPPATPIDGGLGLLLAGGVAYGISRIKKSRR